MQLVLFQTVFELVIWERTFSLFLSWSFLKRASISSLLSAYFGFPSFFLYFHVKIKIRLQLKSYGNCSLNVMIFRLMGICTSRRLEFSEWKITKLVNGYAISRRVLFQNLAQSCSFASVILLVMYLYLFQHAGCKNDI